MAFFFYSGVQASTSECCYQCPKYHLNDTNKLTLQTSMSVWNFNGLCRQIYGWFTQSSEWDKPCTCICHPYDLLYLSHNSDGWCTPLRLISPAGRLFVHVLLLLDNKGHPKAPLTVSFLGVSTDNWWILSTKGGWCGKCFHVMMSLKRHRQTHSAYRCFMT